MTKETQTLTASEHVAINIIIVYYIEIMSNVWGFLWFKIFSCNILDSSSAPHFVVDVAVANVFSPRSLVKLLK